jgi:hypothetical protein
VTVLQWALAHWFLIFVWGLASFFEEVRDFLADGWNAVAGARHQRRVEELAAQAELERARAGTGRPAPEPGPCVHRNVVPVISRADEVVAWLCRSCDTQLAVGWAVREEDL